jgi:hypothetical protein
MAEMLWHRRVLIVSTPRAADPQLVAQQRALSQWKGCSVATYLATS